jgi:anion-transporting  ArsA/GET3 family ATPase
MIQSLLDKKVVFITGKGGTGKTTLTAALAMVAARRRKRVLLVEVDMTRPSIEDIFGRSLSTEPSRLAQNIDGVNIEFMDSLRFYLAQAISVELLVNTILKNKMARYFLESTPFAREIVFLNQFFHQYERQLAGNGYDLVLVDLPATGHALPILSVPTGMERMFRLGPMVKRAREMQAFLADRRRVSLSLVTLPEEMPVTETLEVHERLKQQVPVGLGPVFVNRLPIEDYSDAEEQRLRQLRRRVEGQSPRLEALIDAGEEAWLSSKQARNQLERLEKSLPGPFCLLRELEEPHKEPAATRLAHTLEQML